MARPRHKGHVIRLNAEVDPRGCVKALAALAQGLRTVASFMVVS